MKRDKQLDQDEWYKGFWKSDALPLGIIILMLLGLFVYALFF